ncbi:PREDICTED: uncharacterized protein LOC105359192 [Ceratosolen solmsi marchali]|uniref:Uncharacterized protein LOC105359192 n=1 Tax=Ceratosolen solmsi marchali TaxID=326594 RepID=A0AAJ6YB66_9HYME|nr:PREDICTED: uncharacterized protein LOC105359192 [Ceratosolen solmsi marchali]
MQPLLLLLTSLTLLAYPCLASPHGCFFFCGNEGARPGPYTRPSSHDGLASSRNARMEDLQNRGYDHGYGYGAMDNYGQTARRAQHQQLQPVQSEVEHRPQDLHGVLYFSQTSSSSNSNSNTASHGYLRFPMYGRASRNEYNEYVDHFVA